MPKSDYVRPGDGRPHDPKEIFIGRLTGDPNIRQISGGKKVVSFSILYGQEKGENGQKDNYYLNVTCWNEVAEYAANLEKNDWVLVCGTLEIDDYWTNRKGENQWKMTASMVVVQDTVNSANNFVPFSNNSPAHSGFSDMGDDDELPFE